jgi:hypothetical protein
VGNRDRKPSSGSELLAATSTVGEFPSHAVAGLNRIVIVGKNISSMFA